MIGDVHKNIQRYINPVTGLEGLEGSRNLKLPDFKTIGTWRW